MKVPPRFSHLKTPGTVEKLRAPWRPDSGSHGQQPIALVRVSGRQGKRRRHYRRNPGRQGQRRV